MRWSILVIHICGGVVGLLSGIAAMSFRKGSRRHGMAGNIFFISMLTMASTAALLGNVGGGVFTAYMNTVRPLLVFGRVWVPPANGFSERWSMIVC